MLSDMQCIADPDSLSPADNERMYAFLKKHLELDVSANTTETAVPPVPCKQLTVTRTGQLASDGLSGAVFLPDIVRGATEALERKRAAERSGRPFARVQPLPEVFATADWLLLVKSGRRAD